MAYLLPVIHILPSDSWTWIETGNASTVKTHEKVHTARKSKALRLAMTLGPVASTSLGL